jgi:membrane protein DedA with SNARE-associated domain/rhodanese-related sulfurtransferase
MMELTSAWAEYLYLGIFAAVFLEQLGLPIPSLPLLLGIGALVAAGKIELLPSFLLAVVASLIADLIWYFLGRARGTSILRLICKLSWKQDTCITQTKSLFQKHGTKSLLFSKFVPGLGTLVPPLAGITQVPLSKFLLFNGLGTVLWVGLPLGAGMYFQDRLPQMKAWFEQASSSLPLVCALAVVAYLLWRYTQRQRYLREIAQERARGLTATELQAQLGTGKEFTLIDNRQQLDLELNPHLLPGARWIEHSQLAERLAEIPLAKSIVVYCDCPIDQSAVQSALLLRQLGAQDVRPLLGGLSAWKARGGLTVPYVAAAG